MTFPHPSNLIHLTVDDDLQGTVDESLVERAARRAVTEQGLLEPVEMTVRITDDAEIREVNRRFRGIDSPTDVLSFGWRSDAGEETFSLPPGSTRQLGDVVVSYPRAVEQAEAFGHGIDRELAWLVVHGTLQLLGYRHEDDECAEVMRRREESILFQLGVQ